MKASRTFKKLYGYAPAQAVAVTPEALGFESPRSIDLPDRRALSGNRGPAAGYDTPLKQAWRVAMWERLAAPYPKKRLDRFTGRKREDCSVFLIDTTSGLEIERALSLGFRENNLHVCNMNPAIVATLKRTYSGINTYGVEAAKALQRISSSGIRLNIISLDLCACLSRMVVDTLRAACVAGAACCSIAVNVLRGRESGPFAVDHVGTRPPDIDFFHAPSLRRRLKGLSSMDLTRIEWLFMSALGLISTQKGDYSDSIAIDSDGPLYRVSTVHRKGFLEGFGSYMSGNGTQSMLWAVFGTFWVIRGEVGANMPSGFDMRADSPNASRAPLVSRSGLGFRV